MDMGPCKAAKKIWFLFQVVEARAAHLKAVAEAVAA